MCRTLAPRVVGKAIKLATYCIKSASRRISLLGRVSITGIVAPHEAAACDGERRAPASSDSYSTLVDPSLIRSLTRPEKWSNG